MSVETAIRALPKVDLHVQFEGAISKDFVLLVVEQTDVARNYKKAKDYRNIMDDFKNPNFNRIDEIVREVSAWVNHPDDIARAVYDLAVTYSKQNVKYAEVAVNPAIYTDLGMSFQTLMEALSDGADRAQRAWGVKLSWILSMPRERPRKSDDIARWATSATASKNNVVAMSISGREDAQPIAQFKKAFQTAEKQGLPRITHLFSYPDADSFNGVLEIVMPDRITDAWGLLDDGEAISYLVEHDIPVLVTPSRELKLGRIKQIADYPIQEMLEHGLNVTIGSGMPAMFETTITDEYLKLAEAGVTLPEIQLLIRNGIRAAYLPDEDRTDLMVEFEQAIIELQD
ncbi:MAG: adenosine deaminase family protein [Anaerolineae bacterium]